MGDMFAVPASGISAGGAIAVAALSPPANAVASGPPFEQVLSGTVSRDPSTPAEGRAGAELAPWAQMLPIPIPLAVMPLETAAAAPAAQPAGIAGSFEGPPVTMYGGRQPAGTGNMPAALSSAARAGGVNVELPATSVLSGGRMQPIAVPGSMGSQQADLLSCAGLSGAAGAIAGLGTAQAGSPPHVAGSVQPAQADLAPLVEQHERGASWAAAAGTSPPDLMPPGGIPPRQLAMDEAPLVSPAHSWAPAVLPENAPDWRSAASGGWNQAVPGPSPTTAPFLQERTAASLAADPVWLASTGRLVDAALLARAETAAAIAPADESGGETEGAAGYGPPAERPENVAGRPPTVEPDMERALSGHLDHTVSSRPLMETDGEHDEVRGPGRPSLSGHAARAYDAAAAGAGVPARPVMPPAGPVNAPAARSGALLEAQAAQTIDTATGAAAARTVDQVAGALAVEVRDGRMEAVITLRPEALGEVRARISTGPEGVVIHLSAEHEAVGELLRAQLGDLREALASHQLPIADVHVLPATPPAAFSAAPNATPWPGQQWPRARDEGQEAAEQPAGDEPQEDEE